jgi:hypothetical protein
MAVKAPPLIDRSTLNPVSFVALSFQLSDILVVDGMIALRLVGAIGVPSNVMLAVMEYAEGPFAL